MKPAGWLRAGWETVKTDIAAWLNDLRLRLFAVSDTPALDAEVLLAHTLKVDRAWLLAHRDEAVAQDVLVEIESKASDLEHGIPLPYVIGEWEFFGNQFIVNPAVLIPRPETEQLVEQAIQWFSAHPWQKNALDAGTGTGCIPISISLQNPGCSWLATDISSPALDVAAQNIRRYQLETRITLLQTDVLEGVAGKYPLICSNPPYIPTSVYQSLPVARHEPRHALDGGKDGLMVITKFLQQSARLIASPGLILCEIEETLGPQVEGIANSLFPHASTLVLPDLTGKPRLLKIELE